MTTEEKEMRKVKLMRFCALQMKAVHSRFRELVLNLNGDEDLDDLLEKMPDNLKDWWNDEPLDEKDYGTMNVLYDELVPEGMEICCKRVAVN